ncbi:MCP four helix bundle domain-containing protein [Chitiniphilus eburneus]|nr:MCP four helix bundle domain-containing protein [Chitiniphilus eburneus]
MRGSIAPTSVVPHEFMTMQLTVNQRLVAIMAGALIALLGAGLIAFFGSQKLSEDLRQTDQAVIHSLATLSSIERNFLLIRVNALYHLSYDEADLKKPHEQVILRNISEIERQFREYESGLAANPRDNDLLRQDRRLFAIYRTALDKVLAASNARDREAAIVVVESEWKPAGERLTQALSEHARYKERLVEQVVQQSLQSGQRYTLVAVVATVAGAVLIIAAGLLFKRSLG